MDAYTGFAEVYDLFMDSVPYEEWCERIVGTLREYGIHEGLVLDLGCGTGSMTELLAAAGYDMIGVDASEEMLELADEKKRKSGHDILYLLQDMREFELYGTVRAIVSVCDSLNYITEEKDLLQVFRLAHNYLDPDGVILFDFNTVYKYEEILGESVIAENREEGSFIWENYYDPEERLNEYDLTLYVKEEDGRYRRFEETHFQKAYDRDVILGLLKEAGCRAEKLLDGETGGELRKETERIFIAARREAGADQATAALGRLLSAGAMMGAMMKGDQDLLTLQIKGDGPIGGITVTADSKARVKGYVNEPAVLIPANAKGKLDVAGAIGNGMLRVIKDMGLKEPYVGQTELQTGEIAEDLTYYFATSEQVPSSVGLGVLLNRENTVRQAGGFIIQLMPFTDDKVIDDLEKKLSEVSSVTALLDQGMTPEEILTYLLGDFGLEITDTMPASYYCNCTRDRVEQAIVSIGSRDIREMIQENKPIEVKCQFCNHAYTFDVEDLKKILAKAKK